MKYCLLHPHPVQMDLTSIRPKSHLHTCLLFEDEIIYFLTIILLRVCQHLQWQWPCMQGRLKGDRTAAAASVSGLLFLTHLHATLSCGSHCCSRNHFCCPIDVGQKIMAQFACLPPAPCRPQINYISATDLLLGQKPLVQYCQPILRP